MTPGSFSAVRWGMLSWLQPVKCIGGDNEKLQRGITAGRGLFELLDEPVEVEQGARTLTRADGAIEFRDLHFRYDGQEQDALRGIHLTIKPGQIGRASCRGRVCQYV